MLPTGNKIIGSSAGVVLVCFFLPWILISCEGQTVATFSGWDLAVGGAVQTTFIDQPVLGSPMLFLVLMAAIACLILVGLVFVRLLPLAVGTYAASGLAMLGLLVLVFKLITAQPLVDQPGIPVKIDIHYQYGLWGTILGHLGVIVGASLNLLRKTTSAPVQRPARGDGPPQMPTDRPPVDDRY